MLAVYDTETTGVGKDARIVELASITICNGHVFEFRELCNPGIPIPAGASGVHGIYDHHVADCRSSEEVVADWLAHIADLADQTDGPVVMAGHNNPFDKRIVEYCQPIPYELTLCSLKLARKHSPEFPNHKLGTVYEYLGLTGTHQAHSALDDVRMTLEIICEYCARLGQGYVDIARKQKGGTLLNVMPFGKYKDQPISAIPSSYMEYMLGLSDLDEDVKFTFKLVLKDRRG